MRLVEWHRSIHAVGYSLDLTEIISTAFPAFSRAFDYRLRVRQILSNVLRSSTRKLSTVQTDLSRVRGWFKRTTEGGNLTFQMRIRWSNEIMSWSQPDRLTTDHCVMKTNASRTEQIKSSKTSVCLNWTQWLDSKADCRANATLSSWL